MSNAINVTVEMCEEDRKRLDSLFCMMTELVGEQKQYNHFIRNLAAGATQQKAPAEEATAPQEAPNLEVVKSDHPVDAVPPHAEPQDVAPAAETKPAITLDQIRQKVTYLRASSDQKKKDGAKDIVLAYAPNITGLANCPDKWPEIWDKLTALEG